MDKDNIESRLEGQTALKGANTLAYEVREALKKSDPWAARFYLDNAKAITGLDLDTKALYEGAAFFEEGIKNYKPNTG